MGKQAFFFENFVVLIVLLFHKVFAIINYPQVRRSIDTYACIVSL